MYAPSVGHISLSVSVSRLYVHLSTPNSWFLSNVLIHFNQFTPNILHTMKFWVWLEILRSNVKVRYSESLWQCLWTWFLNTDWRDIDQTFTTGTARVLGKWFDEILEVKVIRSHILGDSLTVLVYLISKHCFNVYWWNLKPKVLRMKIWIWLDFCRSESNGQRSQGQANGCVHNSMCSGAYYTSQTLCHVNDILLQFLKLN